MRSNSFFRCLICLVIVFQTLSVETYCQTPYVDQLSLLNGKKKAVIPFRYIHNFIILDIKLYGIVPLQFIYDTGSEHVILFKKEYTDLLNVPYDKRVPILGSDLSREIWALIMRNVVVEVKGLRPKPYDILVLEEDYVKLDQMVGVPISGLIGGEIFKSLIVNIDYKKSRMTLYDPHYFENPKGCSIVPIDIKSNKPYVKGTATLQDGTEVEVELLVDTGAGIPMLLHNNSHPALHLPEQFIRGNLGMGLGGYLEGHIGRIQNMRIGNIDFPSVLAGFQDVDSTWLTDKSKSRNGIMGNEFLNRFNTWFNYTDGELLLLSYKSKPRPFSMDRSGLVLFAYGQNFNQFVVQDVISNSPAQRADFQTNDVILYIKGISVKHFTLEGINQILQKKAGKKVRFKILRGKEILHKQIVLEDLI